GTDSVYIAAYDGQTWGSQTATITTQKANQAPVVSAIDQTVRRNQTIQPSFGVTDADGDKITSYFFYDTNTSSTSGYFTVNGVKQADTGFSVDADKLGTVSFVGGSTASSDYVYTRGYDGTAWSDWKGYTIQTQGGSSPVVTVSDQTVNANESIKLSLSATDADGDKVTQYAFYDGNSSSTSGYFTVNGVKQAAGQYFYLDANQLDTLRFVGGTVAGVDAVYAAVSDGVDGWSSGKPFNVSTKSVVVADWFEQNIKDLTIRSLARSRFQDGSLDRTDMIDIFNKAKESGVTANEFADLQTLTKNTEYIQMPEYVRVLSKKISEGNPANNSYQGISLGNLQAGSTEDQLGKLIQEHFFGGDRPLPTGNYSYANAAGNLFVSGVSYEDIKQGFVGDCYFLASLAAVALKTPNVIQEMFTDNRDGTYTVRFFNNGKADYVTVDRYLPVYSHEALVYANVGGDWNKYHDSGNELWVALAEKAYAQINEAGWLGRDNTNTYQGINLGRSDESTPHISGKSGNYYSIQAATPSTIVDAFNSGKSIIFSSKKLGVSEPVVSQHGYTMVGYNQATAQFKLFNPHGIGNSKDGGYLNFTWSQIQAYCDEVAVNA
ncbi:C2 family cysteine protease, partial [Microcoleus sp. herbarium19]|uniref:C2 family cysteine protease n=1 Tax=unclassified Microcoleus TaxID=2642155 RepID=UPI002FD02BB0